MKLTAIVVGLTLVASCSSPGSRGAKPEITGHPQRVAYVDYRRGLVLELVNESHTGRVEQYSQVRGSADRKVQSDEVLKGLIDSIRGQGFPRLANQGPAPRASDGQVTMAVEIEDGGRIEHVLGVRGMPGTDRQAVLTMAQYFVEIYNATYGLQAVETKPGQDVFKNPVGPTKQKPAKVNGTI